MKLMYAPHLAIHGCPCSTGRLKDKLHQERQLKSMTPNISLVGEVNFPSPAPVELRLKDAMSSRRLRGRRRNARRLWGPRE